MDEHVFFQLIPVRQFEWFFDESAQRIIIKRPKYLSKWAQTLLGPFTGKSYFKIKLDDIGSQVWQLCDGQRTVGEIFKQLEQILPEEQDLKGRFTIFIKQLTRQKFLLLLQKIEQDPSTTR